MFGINYDLSLAGMSMASPLQHVSALFVFLEHGLLSGRNLQLTTHKTTKKKLLVVG